MSKAETVALLARNVEACVKDIKQNLQNIEAFRQKLAAEGYELQGSAIVTDFLIVTEPRIMGQLTVPTIAEINKPTGTRAETEPVQVVSDSRESASTRTGESEDS